MSHLARYADDILSGKIPASQKIKQQYERLYYDLHNPGKYHFDEARANRHIEFIERFCRQSKGRLGSPLVLQPFQKAKLQAVFGFVDDAGIRRYKEVIDIRGRKNGKTTEAAAIELDMLCNDGEGSPEVYNLATKRDQALIGFAECHNMVKQSPLLRKHVRKRQSDLYMPRNMGIIKPLASNSNTLDGLNGSAAIIDELSAIKNRDLYDLVKQSMSARRQPLLFEISTSGYVRNCIYDSQYEYAEEVLLGNVADETLLSLIYEMDEYDEIHDETYWIKANPGLDTIKRREFLRECLMKAQNDPGFMPTVLCKDFNLPQNVASAWLSYDTARNSATIPDHHFVYGVGGFDAADCGDLTAARLLFMRPNDPRIYSKSMYWLPENEIDWWEDRGKRQGRDNVPYTIWRDQGLLRVVPGTKVDKSVILDWFVEQRDIYDIYPMYIGYDQWHIDDSLLARFRREFGDRCMKEVRQGTRSLSAPMKELKIDLDAKIIVTNDHPIDLWTLLNVEIKTDINGEIQPVKGLDKRKRIDGAIALICAYKMLKDHWDEYQSAIQYIPKINV